MDNDFLSFLLKRRSIRIYKKQPIEKEKLELVLKAGLCAPTGRNRKEWEFLVTEDPEKLLALSCCKDSFADFVKAAPCAVVVFGDKEATDIWPEDCSIALTQMMLMAETQGLGSCWVHLRNRTKDGRPAEEILRELFSVPENLSPCALLALGYPDASPHGHSKEHLPLEKVHYESF